MTGFLHEKEFSRTTFLKGGGGVVLLLDPASLPNLTGFLDSMGLVLGDNFVVDHERRVLATDGLAAVVESPAMLKMLSRTSTIGSPLLIARP